jgi:uncharacterized protein (TIGR00297 family)
MVTRRTDGPLAWQSKVILLLVLPWTVGFVILQSRWWSTQIPVVAYTTLGVSAIFGLIVWRLRAATARAAETGAVITASLMFATSSFPYQYSWLHGALLPLLSVFIMAFLATRIGKARKELLGTAESKRGRNAAQVSANLGAAALFGSIDPGTFYTLGPILAIAALAEAAADTVSSEIGQVFGGQPRMITSLKRVEAGTDGAITFIGTAAGAIASAVVSAIATLLWGETWRMWLVWTFAGVFGLLFDSLLGATIERRRWLNNDAVNFLSTISASVFAFVVIQALEIFGHSAFPHVVMY